MQHEPIVSVLLPTVQPWPEIAASLASLTLQETTVPFEVLLVDGDGAGLAEEPSHPSVRWLRLPGADTFVLRAAGLSAARGELVAISEDHCLAPRNWIEAIVTAHRADPRTALVGTTKNHPDSSGTAFDRANFLLTFAGQNAARLQIDHRRLPTPTNVSFKRAAFAATEWEAGALEYRCLAQWRETGALGIAPRVVLQHKQSWGRATSAVHFASGRSYGASTRAWPWRERLRWWGKLPLLPLQLWRLVSPDLREGAGGAPASASDVLGVATLILANAVGQAYGALFGVGRSRERL